jgi:hypothetical protein
MVRLAELTSPAARLARDPRAVGLLPLGAIEQHGPHLRFVLTNYQAHPDHLAAFVPARRALSGRRIPVLGAFLGRSQRALILDRIAAPR